VPTIHPSATIDPQVQLADDVVVGRECIIEGPVTIGPGTRLLARVWLKGPLTIGCGNVIYPNTFIGFEPQDLKFDPTVAGAGTVIGDHNIIREASTIHRATKDRPTSLGSHCYLMVNAHVGHDCQVADHVILCNGMLLAGHAEVGDGAILSGNAVVHQFCRVGRLAMLAGAQGVTKDVPPFCIVYSTRRVSMLNLVGLRRAGLRQHIKPLMQAFDICYKRGMPNSKAARIIEDELGDDPLCRQFAHFVRDTRRGITPYAGMSAGEEDPE